MTNTEMVTLPVNLVFRGNQLKLYRMLNSTPLPTFIFAEVMELPTKNISKQLQQMADNTGLVKFERYGKLKRWYK